MELDSSTRDISSAAVETDRDSARNQFFNGEAMLSSSTPISLDEGSTKQRNLYDDSADDSSNFHQEEAFLASVGLQPRDVVHMRSVKRSEAGTVSGELPDGWRRIYVRRQAGQTAGKLDCYIYSPDGRKHRSKTELATYLKSKGIDMDLKKFDFTVKHAQLSNGSTVDSLSSKSPSKRAADSLLDSAKRKASKSKRARTVETEKTVEEGEEVNKSVAKRPRLSGTPKVTPRNPLLEIYSAGRTPNSGGRTPNSGRRTSNSGGRTPNSGSRLLVRMNFKQKPQRLENEDTSSSSSTSHVNERPEEDKRASRKNTMKDSETINDSKVEKTDLPYLNERSPAVLNGSSSLIADTQQTSQFVKNARSLLSSMTKSTGNKFSSSNVGTTLNDVVINNLSLFGTGFNNAKISFDGSANIRTFVDISVIESDGTVLPPPDWHHSHLAWTPPPSPFNLVEEHWHKDPWRILVTSLFYQLTETNTPRRALVAFFRYCPSASTLNCNKLKNISSSLKQYGITETFVDTLYQFTVEYLTKSWVYPIELHAVGECGNDAYRIFCINEWKQVAPSNPRLNAYHRWLWKNKRAFNL